jgi:hypothetical protein
LSTGIIEVALCARPRGNGVRAHALGCRLRSATIIVAQGDTSYSSGRSTSSVRLRRVPWKFTSPIDLSAPASAVANTNQRAAVDAAVLATPLDYEPCIRESHSYNESHPGRLVIGARARARLRRPTATGADSARDIGYADGLDTIGGQRDRRKWFRVQRARHRLRIAGASRKVPTASLTTGDREEDPVAHGRTGARHRSFEP